MNAINATIESAGATAPDRTAVVLACADGRITLTHGGDAARLATSCLVQPEPGDLVLVADTASGPFVLAILASAEPRALRIAAACGLTIATARFGVTAQDLCLDAGDLNVSAREGTFAIGTILHIGRSLVSHAARLRLVGERIEAVVTDVILRARRSLRILAETDHVQSRDIDHRASGGYTLEADHAVLTAQQIVKLDADQIHMG